MKGMDIRSEFGRGAAACLLLASAAVSAGPACRFAAGDLTVELDGKGVVTGLFDPSGRNYATAAPLPVHPLVKLVAAPEAGELSGEDGTAVLPESLDAEGDLLTFRFPRGMKVKIALSRKRRYTVLTVAELDKNGGDVELLMWGPILTTMKEGFGETLGVLYTPDFAIGYRGLNDKTQMCAPFEYAGGHEGNRRHLNVTFPIEHKRIRGRKHGHDLSAAAPAAFGSFLQGFTYDATRERVRWAQYRRVGPQRVPPLRDPAEACIAGSSIALYGRARGKLPAIRDAVLDTVSEMELAEGLPHPLCRDGVWGKVSPCANEPYLICSDINDSDPGKMARAAEYARRAGYHYIYRDGFFRSCGAYSFPRGVESAKRCVDAAGEKGVYVGAHSLSGFISNNDPYATGRRGLLAGSRAAFLAADAPAGAGALRVTADYEAYTEDFQLGSRRLGIPKAEKQPDGTFLLTLGRPLEEPAKKGDALYNLYRNGYGGMLAGPDQIPEIAGNLADALCGAGMAMTSFDGVEAGRAIGLGNYGANRMMNEMWRRMERRGHAHLVCGASRGIPNGWHTATRPNWGEPWGLGMRKSMIEYRYNNQYYLDRNFIPRMLGWFLHVAGQPLVDIEWMLAKSAGFDAGFALVVSLDVLDGSGNTDAVIAALREWEAARRAGAFTEDQRKRLLDTSLDWRLERAGEKEWRLFCVAYQADPASRAADGRPLEYRFFNPYRGQPLRLELRAVNGAVRNPAVALGGKRAAFAGTIPKGGRLLYAGGGVAELRDARWNLLGTVKADGPALSLAKGANRISVSFAGENGSVALEARARSESLPERVFPGNPARGPAEYRAKDLTGAERRKNLLLGRTPRMIEFDTGKEVRNSRLACVTDGAAARGGGIFMAFPEKRCCLLFDMGREAMLDTVRYFGETTAHYPKATHTPLRVVIAVSTSPDFAEGRTRIVYNSDRENFWGFGAGGDAPEANRPGGLTVRFPPVKARYLRYCQRGAAQKGTRDWSACIGAAELEAYAVCGPGDVRQAVTDTLQTTLRRRPRLPGLVMAEFGDGRIAPVPVDWGPLPGDAFEKAGRAPVRGRLRGAAFEVEETVLVRDGPIALIDGPGAAPEGAAVRMRVGAAGAEGASRMDFRIYWEKAKLFFGGDGSGVRVDAPGAEILSLSVNNESSLIDLSIRFARPLTGEEAARALTLTFRAEAAGLGRVESKLVEFLRDGKRLTAENQRHYIFVTRPSP